ncbi:hypothetical protein JW707_01025 [Candidatus Woesearchaeota archaeon]|nr:hypothetical protein [Candidatus Woesearchaeota archaeon]
MKKEARKGQVTVFIIIGLILLVSASIIIYLTTLRKVEVIEEVVVPPEVKPIYDYVTNCLYEIGSDSLVLVGTQGGYADLSPERVDTRDITLTPTAYVKIDPTNTFKLPHWFYEGEDRTPPLEFIQKEIADYVNNNLQACLNNFDDFRPSFEVTALGSPKLTSVLTDNDVVVMLDYPLEITSGGKTTEHSEFITHLPVKLKKMWGLAKAILDAENEENLLENLTIDLMAMSPDVPMDSLDITCRPQIWRLDDVEKSVQQLVRYNVMKIRVKGTDYPPFLADESVYEELSEYDMEDINEGRFPDIPTPRDAFEYSRMMIDPGVGGVEDMVVNFVYLPSWGMDLNGLPNEAGILRSNAAPGQSFLKFLCINTYHFVYDVIYPVQVRIFDPSAYSGRGYTFQFAFPVLIDDNDANRETFGVRKFQDYYVDVGFCEQAGGDVVEIKAIGRDAEGYLMTSGLKDVNISYHCFNQRCTLGTTGYNMNAPGRYALITALPPGCANPIIEADKEGYLQGKAQLVGNKLDIEMTRLSRKNVVFEKHPYRKDAGLSQNSEELAMGDTVSLYIKLRGYPVAHETFFTYSYGDNETPTIDLVEGDAQYDIDIMLHNYDRFVGGYKARNVTIKYSDLEGYEDAVFHVFEYRPRPTQSEDIMDMTMFFMDEGYAEDLAPTFR